MTDPSRGACRRTGAAVADRAAGPAPARRRSRWSLGGGDRHGRGGLGLLWWRLAPTATTVVQDGGVYLQGHDELMVAQDGWFAILGAVDRRAAVGRLADLPCGAPVRRVWSPGWSALAAPG